MRVVALVAFAMFCIVGGDTAGTLLTGIGVPAPFVAWTRFAVAAVVLLPLAGLRLAALPGLADWRLWLRAGLIVAGITCILTSLRTEPLANAFAAFFVGPIVSYILSALLLGERVTLLRSLLLGVSFVGVLLVVRPGFGMTPGILFAFAAGCFHGGYLVATRWLAGHYRPRFLLWSQLAIGSVLLAPAGMMDLPQFEPVMWLWVLLSALGSAAGNYILVLVNRTTPASVVAPLVYSQLIAAMFFGLVVFGEWPDLLTLAALAIILLSGVASVRAAGQDR